MAMGKEKRDAVMNDQDSSCDTSASQAMIAILQELEEISTFDLGASFCYLPQPPIFSGSKTDPSKAFSRQEQEARYESLRSSAT